MVQQANLIRFTCPFLFPPREAPESFAFSASSASSAISALTCFDQPHEQSDRDNGKRATPTGQSGFTEARINAELSENAELAEKKSQ
jgi:hypothetical protein